ncbi:MAG: hypothetical protein KME21_21325 [Desmonostoc vinosum HA7617-LM4]|nr:hypothetical protein [Desmonostoc vinosum HA7617-LM4]
MTFAISKELQFLAGHRFYVKLTPILDSAGDWELYFSLISRLVSEVVLRSRTRRVPHLPHP